jgi:hypothetical protein
MVIGNWKSENSGQVRGDLSYNMPVAAVMAVMMKRNMCDVF